MHLHFQESDLTVVTLDTNRRFDNQACL